VSRHPRNPHSFHSNSGGTCELRLALVASRAMPKRREKTIDEGDAKIISDQAPSAVDGLDLARSILEECPDGYHPWRVEIQKSDRGRRAAVRVWFKRNALRGEDSQQD
jgi:hypothetical protein